MSIWTRKNRPVSSPLGVSYGEIDVVIPPAGMIQVNSTIYLQKQLGELGSDHIRLKIVKPRKAIPPNGWRSIDADYALIGKHQKLYGTLCSDALAKSGWKCGDTVLAYVGIPPKHGKNYTLWLPKK